MFRIIFFLSLIFSNYLILVAQKPGLIFHHISVNDGLSENTVRDIIEDKKGFMWFGTDDGLNKYDGYKFTIYKESNTDIFSISSSAFNLFFVDSKNNIWILTTNGVNIYDPVLDVFYNFNNNKHVALKNLTGDFQGITEDKKGNIWLSNVETGLYKVEDLNKSPKHYSLRFRDNNKLIAGLAIDTDSTLWIGTKDGLLKFNSNTSSFQDLRFQYGQGYEVRYLHKDEKGKLWVCTTNGLKVISRNGSMKGYYNLPSDPNSLIYNNVSKITPYKKDNFLLALDGGGIEYFDVKNEKFYHYTDENESQLSSNNVISIFKDSKGDIWSGTYLNGINYSNETTNLFILIKNNPFSDKSIKKGIVERFLKDKSGNFWVATDGGGLFKKNKSSETFIQFKEDQSDLPKNKVISLLEDKEGFIWITTYGGGLSKYNPKNNSFKTYKPNPSKAYFISNDQVKNMCLYNNRIWISTYGTGISVLDSKTDRFTNYRFDKYYPESIPSDWAIDFLVDKNNTLWITTLNGLCKFNPDKNNFKNFLFESKESSININTLSEIIQDIYGNIWIGSDGGLILFNPSDESYKVYTTKEGLTNNYIKSIIEDNHTNLWISTNNGITQLNTITKKAKAYTVQDGVPPCSFTSHAKYKDEQGRIYFGTNNGYLVIDPNMTGENKLIPPVVITELKILNQVVSPRGKDSPLKTNITETSEIDLSYDQNSIAFEFAALNFNSSQNNRYAYWLEGFENTWVNAEGHRKATYTNLNPGRYIFRVKASNNDNIWNEEGVSIKINITPPFWKTWWFNTLIISSLLLLLYLIFFWRTNRIRNKNAALEETVIKRTSELKEANEQLEAFVYKASHDIKGPLRSIIGLTTIGQKDVKDETALNYFDHILKSTKKLDTLLRDLLEVTKVKQATIQKEQINFTEMVNEGIARFENLPGFEKMKFNIKIEERIPFYSDKKLVFSLIQNLIENPIKYADFTKSSSSLNIDISTSEKGVELIFKDNGIGIPEEFQKKVFDMFFKVNESSNGTGLGLYIVKTTVEKLGGTVRMESTAGMGSVFILKL